MKALLTLLLSLLCLTASASPGQPYFVRQLSQGAAYSPALTNSLVYYWGMESTGDETNYVNGGLPTHGTVAATTNGVISNAVVCPISPGGAAAVPDTYWTNKDWTVCGWFKVTAWNNSDVMMGHYEGGNNSWFIQEDSVSGALKTMFWDKNNTAVQWNTTTAANTWQFWALGYSPTSNVCWFQADGGYRYSTTLATTLKTVSGQPFESGGHFTGALDEVGIWNRTLSPSEVGWLFNDGKGRSFLELHSNYYSNDYYAASMASEWTNRVVLNGGSVPSTNTTSAVANFLTRLNSDGTFDKMLTCCCFVPDNLTAAITPIIKVKGNDPWTQNNFVAGDLTTNGLAGNKSNKYLNTGFNPATGWTSDTNGGLSAYFYDFGTLTANSWIGCYGNGGPFDGLSVNDAGGIWTTVCCHDQSGAGYIGARWAVPGFYSYSRGAPNYLAEWFASSTNSWFMLTNGTGTISVSRANAQMYVFALDQINTPGLYSDYRLSFLAIHNALTPVQGSNLFNAVQSLRTSLGGGYR